MAIKFRAGDVVSIKAIVKFNYAPDEEKHIALDVPDSISSGLWVKADAVTAVQQKIVVGDMIWTDDLGKELPGKVIFIHAGSAWIDVDGVMYTHTIEALRRAEDVA